MNVTYVYAKYRKHIACEFIALAPSPVFSLPVAGNVSKNIPSCVGR